MANVVNPVQNGANQNEAIWLFENQRPRRPRISEEARERIRKIALVAAIVLVVAMFALAYLAIFSHNPLLGIVSLLGVGTLLSLGIGFHSWFVQWHKRQWQQYREASHLAAVAYIEAWQQWTNAV